MRITIIDDEAEERNKLHQYIERFGREQGQTFEISEYTSGSELLAQYRPVHDILIFDIDMPGISGMEAARAVRKIDEKAAILFVTNIAQYAINGYEVDAVDYIIKPIGYYDFSMRLKKALRWVQRAPERQIVVETVSGVMKLRVSDIYFLESQGHYVTYHTKNGDFRVRGKLKDHEDELKSDHFRRTHKSFVINLMYLDNVLNTDVVVAGQQVPLGRAHRDAVISDFMRYIRG